jgi:FMN phosphatase YigB (HAD superfamily)
MPHSIITPYIASKKAFVFDLDNTLYPEKDFLYQVYYMIGQFIEYQETHEHDKVTRFLVDEFEQHGRTRLFDKLIDRFMLKPEYMENFLRLLRTARLPLKLLLFPQMELLLNELVKEGKQLYILTNGTPEQQFNKVMQVEWKGLQHHIKCYFSNEIKPKPAPDSLLKLMEDQGLELQELVFIGDGEEDRLCAGAAGVDYLDVQALLTETEY